MRRMTRPQTVAKHDRGIYHFGGLGDRAILARARCPAEPDTFQDGSGHEQLDAAGDVERDAGHVGGEVGAEERDRVGDVLRLAGALETVRFAIRSFMAGFAMWNASVPMIPGTIALQVIP